LVQALYLDGLGRAGSKDELHSWAEMLSNGTGTQASVTFAIDRSEEARDHLGRSWHASCLGRRAGNGEELGLVSALQAGQSNEQVLAAIFASSESFDRAQSLVFTSTPEQRFVDALYMLLLDRAEAGTAYLSGQLAMLGRRGVAQAFLASTELRTDQFEGYYEALRHWTGDANGLDYGAALNLDMDTVRVAFEANMEFFNDG
jgi:hypothetical protein